MNIEDSLVKLTKMKPNYMEEVIIEDKKDNSRSKLYPNHSFGSNRDIKIVKIKKLEKRTKGLIYTDIYKTYSFVKNTKNDFDISEIYEKQLIFTKEKLEKDLANFNFDNTNARDIFSRFKILENSNILKALSNYDSFLVINTKENNLFSNNIWLLQ